MSPSHFSEGGRSALPDSGFRQPRSHQSGRMPCECTLDNALVREKYPVWALLVPSREGYPRPPAAYLTAAQGKPQVLNVTSGRTAHLPRRSPWTRSRPSSDAKMATAEARLAGITRNGDGAPRPLSVK